MKQNTQKIGLIYRAYDSEGKSYIGQTVKGIEVRRNQHEKSKLEDDFHKALKEKEFQWEILEDNIPEYKLLERERYWAKVFDSQQNGYNGDRINCFNRKYAANRKGKHHTEEAKKKISETHKGKSTWIKGNHHSEETKKKIGKANSISLKGHSPGNKGTHLTNEQKQKLREINTGKRLSEEHKRKISEAMRKRKGEI